MTEGILQRVERVALGLGEIADRVVFVGGCIPAFYVNLDKFEEPRPTEDVDCIIELCSLADHQRLEHALRTKGFRHDSSMIARWEYQGIIVDIMPTEKGILGFASRWYNSAIASARRVTLPSGTTCNILDLPHFFATKLESLGDRGEDLRMSKDLEDIIYLLNSCDTVMSELASGSEVIRTYLSEEFLKLRRVKNFDELLSAHLSHENQRRKSIIVSRIDNVISQKRDG